MRRLRNVAMGLTILLLAAAPVLAQANDALEIVPADALGFGVVNNLEKASAKVEAMLKRLKVPLEGSPLKKVLSDLGATKGINEKGSLVVAALPGEQPVGLIIVPVSDYKDFAESLKAKDASGKITAVETANGHSMAMGKKGDYAVMVEAEHKDTLKKVLDGQGGIARVVKPLQGWIAENDLGLVITSKGIEYLVAKGRDGLGQFKNIPLPDEAKFVLGFIDGIDEFLKKSAKEVTHIAVGGKFADQGDLQLDIQALFAKGGNFAKFGAQAKGMTGGPLAGLPAGPFVLAGGGGLSGQTMKGLTGFSVEIIKAMAPDLPAAMGKKLDQAYEGMYQGVSGTSFVMGVGKAGESILGGMMVVMKVDDSAAFMKRYEKSMMELNEVFKTGKIPMQKPFEIKNVKVGQVPALEIINDMSESLGQLPPKIGELIFGDGAKMRASVVPGDDSTILIGYASPEGMKKSLAAFKKKAYLNDDAELAKTAALLPKGAQWAGYFSPKGAMDMANRVIGGFLPIQLPAFPDTPPVGAGIRLSASGLEARIVVPASVQDGVGDLTQKVMQLIGGGN